jgi:transposase
LRLCTTFHNRKSFLLIGSDEGGERAAILYTLIESAKLNGLDLEAYLAYVIDRLARGHLASMLGELLPWNYKAAITPKPA